MDTMTPAQSLAFHAGLICAWQLSRELAEALDGSTDDIFGVFDALEFDVLAMLTRPDGWVSLAEFAALKLGKATAYRPTLH